MSDIETPKEELFISTLSFIISILLILLGVGYSYGMILEVPDELENIQAGLDAAGIGDTVLVEPGVYSGNGNYNLSFHGKDIVLKSKEGALTTIIDCLSNGRGFLFVNGETEASKVVGFTIKNGLALLGSDGGGGIYCHSSDPVFIDCKITDCCGLDWGGGAYCVYSGARFTNCEFSDNEGYTRGGGLYFHESAITIRNCLFERNLAIGHGGGVFSCFSTPVIKGCIVRNNQASENGGGIVCANSSNAVISRCVISENSAGGIQGGGGIYCQNQSYASVTNCIITDNNAEMGGGIGLRHPSTNMDIINCTFYGNTAESGSVACTKDWANAPHFTNCILWSNSPGIFQIEGQDLIVEYSDVQGGWPGQGNMDTDPLFIMAGNGNFHLDKSSPCIDTGTDITIDNDIDGDLRPMDGAFDMGADEWRQITIDFISPEPNNKIGLPLSVEAKIKNDSQKKAAFDKILFLFTGPTNRKEVIYDMTDPIFLNPMFTMFESFTAETDSLLPGDYTVTLQLTLYEKIVSRNSFPTFMSPGGINPASPSND